jgi:hypothetical protein
MYAKVSTCLSAAYSVLGFTGVLSDIDSTLALKKRFKKFTIESLTAKLH